jgi:hypothetical protein
MMLPNFFVIGAPRSGTTSLYEYLNAHPDVYMSPKKEPDFFSYPALGEVHPLDAEPGERSLADDAPTNDQLAADFAKYEGLFAKAGDQRRVGEASAIYLGDPLAAWHLLSYRPDAKFIVVLRDPAERAFSHFVHAKRIYAEHSPQSAADDQSVEQEFTRVIDVALAEGMPLELNSEQEIWIRAGFYHAHLTRWYELFDRDRFKLFLFEDLAADPHLLMKEVFGHLDIDDSFELPTTEAFNASVVPRNQQLFRMFTTANPVMRRARAMAPTSVRAAALRTRNRLLGDSKPGIDVDLHGQLRSIYRDDTVALQELIGRDLTGWLDD